MKPYHLAGALTGVLVLGFLVWRFDVFSLRALKPDSIWLQQGRMCELCYAHQSSHANWVHNRQKRIKALSEIKFLDNSFALEPEWKCHTPLLTLGPLNVIEGAKSICRDAPVPHFTSAESCTVFSVGSNGEFDFEEGIAKTLPACKIHTFDPTFIPDPPAQDTISRLKISYHTTGVSDKYVEKFYKGDVKPLTQIVSELKVTHLPVLKIDCEFCEHDAFLNDIFPAMKAGKLSIDLVLVEIHVPREKPEMLAKWLAAADEVGLRLYFFEFNTASIKEWHCAEYAFIYAPTPECGLCSRLRDLDVEL